MGSLLECADQLGGRDTQRQEILTWQLGARNAWSIPSDAEWWGDGRPDQEEPRSGWSVGVGGGGMLSAGFTLSVEHEARLARPQRK